MMQSVTDTERMRNKVLKSDKYIKQAGAELGQAQFKIG